MITVFKKGETVGNKKVPTESFLELYPVSDGGEKKRLFLIVIPGGGYTHLAEHEGKAVAEWLNEKGIHAAVFYYQLQQVDLNLLLEQLDEVLVGLRSTSLCHDVKINQIGLMGFSAGGHLTALAATKNTHKPDFFVLGYPVISLEEPYVHRGSRTQILGDNPSKTNLFDYSPEQWISSKTPPVFLWHTANDQSVPIENSLLFAKQLSKQQIPFELHVFPEGRHGLGLAQGVLAVHQWTHLLEGWLKQQEEGGKGYEG